MAGVHMLLSALFTFESPGVFAAACALAVAALAAAWRRRPAVARMTTALALVALILLALAAGGLTWHRPAGTEVVVMVDLSASTRGATYRDRDALERRVKELIGQTPYHVVYFAQQNSAEAPGDGRRLADLPGERTTYAPPAAVAVILFSDGRFPPPPVAPPTFVVADPSLDDPGDGAVTRLERRGDDVAATVRVDGTPRRLTIPRATTQATVNLEPGDVTVVRPAPAADRTVAARLDGDDVAATVHVGRPPRRLTMPGATTQATVNLEPGDVTVVRPAPPADRTVAARLDGGDRWPENDALSIALAAPMHTQRWWVSSTGSRLPRPGEWVTLTPSNLPTDAAEWLAPGVVVLDDVAAGELADAQTRRLEQYVRDLGGALVIGGGEHAFAGGFYPGTALEALSPLASAPPRPAVHWMLLADSSGSMSQPVAPGGPTRWELAASAVTRLLANLPPDDAVSVGSFAAELTWWTTGRSAREVAAMTLPPPGVGPNGPTNLEAALDRVARETLAGGLATELLVVSDADTTFTAPDTLAAGLKSKNVRLHVLAIGEGRGLEPLGRITAATGGALRRELDPRQWATEVRRLLESAWPKRLMPEPTRVTFTGDLASLPARVVSPWNRTWLKGRGAAELARTQRDDQSIPMAARWSAGSGEVVSVAFAPASAEVEAIAARIARPPRDPRFRVTWDAGSRLALRVDATDGGKYLNGLRIRMEIAPADGQTPASSTDVPQVGPGRYEASMDAPRSPSFATLLHDGRVIDRIPVAGRYAPEFDAIGNDYDAMRALAERTGGRLIDRTWTKPLDLPFPRRELPLGPWLALAAVVALGLGLARWRYG